ncbi:hypothetical protein [Pseudoduganella sp. UC29_71]|uniref:hypothetical protein n=1 Tax=Pseudoduganella sp. UC29_71 TaxID=3350174 RepID=UPI00366DF69A
MWLLGALYAAAVLSVLPFATNDGPVHMSFARLLGGGLDSGVLQAQHYRANGALHPNLAVYGLAVLLLKGMRPELAEALVQLACLLGPVAGMALVLGQFQRRQQWVALFAFPLALHQLFFLGLYNYCLSVTGFLVSIAALMWMQKRPGAARAAAPIAALYFTYFSHAAGFLAAMVATGVLTALSFAAAWREPGADAEEAVRRHARHAAVLMSPLPLALLAMGGAPDAAGTGFAFGAPLDQRLKSFAILSPLNLQHTPLDRYLVPLLAAAILGSVAVLAVLAALAALAAPAGRSALAPARFPVNGRARAALLLFAALLALALAFPDTAGGGWTHYRRMQMFPYFAGLLCMACLRLRRRVRNALAALAIAVSLALLAGGTWRQQRIKQQLAPMLEVERLVGRHCTVLPLLLDDGGAWASGMALPPKYRPFFHAATRLELHGDRVALFNYLARLQVYPVQFKPGQDTQALLFHWLPQQEGTAVARVDIAGYERASGQAVDYILQWGALPSAPAPLRAEVLRALAGYAPVYTARGGAVRLYRRAAPAAGAGPRSHCAPPAPD